MCICETASKNKIPEGRAGVVETKSGYFLAFHIGKYKPEDTSIPIRYCPFCGRELLK